MLKLEIQGLLSIGNRLNDFFTDVADGKRKITIHQLLMHLAGFFPLVGDDYSEISTNEFIDLSLGRSLLFELGAAFEYSNVGYSLLGIIVERLSGLSYEA